MSALLEDPMVQAGVAPFLVALAVAYALASLRLAWLGIVAGVVTAIALSTGIAFSPLTASRKIVLLVMVAPAVGVVLDRFGRPNAVLVSALAALAGLASAWVFQSVLAQRTGLQALGLGAGVALFVALLVGLVLRLRDDGVGAGAATLGLGLAVGISAVLSASIGNMMNGVALAAGGGALLLLQLLRGHALAAGFTGTLTVGVAAALFAAATLVLSELRWFVLVLFLAVPVAAAWPLFEGRSERWKLVLRSLVSVAAALAAILAAWLATRFPAS